MQLAMGGGHFLIQKILLQSGKYQSTHTFVSTQYFFRQVNRKPFRKPYSRSIKKTTCLALITELPKAETPKIEISKPTLIYNSYNLDPNWRKDEDVNRILLLEPSHFKKFPIGSKVMEFILNLSKNISGIQIMVDEVSQLRLLYNDSPLRKGA